jgi:hypothetical protein
MTLEEVLDVSAGRELDALVAEKVMGWVYREYWGQLVPSEHLDAPMWSEWAQDKSGDVCRHPINRMPNIPYRGDKPWIPEYSTDISAAWEVVEKNKEYWFFLMYSADMKQWWCEYRVNKQKGRVTADTAPLAICRAALLAMSE